MRMDLPSKHVLDLSKRIGARGPGTDGEKAAANYILKTMSDFDVDVDVESFSSWKSDQHSVIILYVAAVSAYALFQFSYPLSIVIASLVFLLFQMETYSWGVLSRLLPRSTASNIIGKVAPAGRPAQTVVLVANYDSARSSPLGRPRVARLFRALSIVSFVSIIAIGLLAIFGQGASLVKIADETIFTVWLFLMPFPAYLLVLAVIMLWGESRGRYTAGANDNASGVGVMLSVLDSLAADPLEHTEVWGVATGRGSAGGRGMVALLKRHRQVLKGAYIFNLDHLGLGDTKIITVEGALIGFKASRRLTRLALSTSDMMPGPKMAKGKCRVKRSDAMVATVRGFRALTIGGTKGGSYEGWRDDDDVYDRIKRASLDRAVKFVAKLLDDIDELPRRRRRPTRRVRPVPGRDDEEPGVEEAVEEPPGEDDETESGRADERPAGPRRRPRPTRR